MIRLLRKKYNRFKHWLDFDPPGALTSKGWRLFKAEFKEKAPFRFWIKHNLRYGYLMPIKWKYDKIADWIRYRTLDRYHVVKTGLKPGYHDVSETMLYTNFNMLKDFVEVELAWQKYCWSNIRKERAGFFEKYMPFYYRFFPFRDPALGVEHLKWETTLDDPALPPHERCDHQAVSAREKLALYNWWVNERPARVPIEYITFNRQGFEMPILDDDFDTEAPDFKAFSKNMDDIKEQEDNWEEEDNEMLVRLVKIRKSLWT